MLTLINAENPLKRCRAGERKENAPEKWAKRGEKGWKIVWIREISNAAPGRDASALRYGGNQKIDAVNL